MKIDWEFVAKCFKAGMIMFVLVFLILLPLFAGGLKLWLFFFSIPMVIFILGLICHYIAPKIFNEINSDDDYY